jgi:hypothetical protein
LVVNRIHTCNEQCLVISEGTLVAVKKGNPRSGALLGGKSLLFSGCHVS